MAIQEGQEEPLKRMTKLVNHFLSRSDCGPFREPVDWRGLELFDYPKIISKMMDLGTVKRKLERQQYSTAADCAADIRLIWTNCMTYNADGSDFWLLAKTFSKRFEDRYRKLKQDFPGLEDKAAANGSQAVESSSKRTSQTSNSNTSGSKSGGTNNGENQSNKNNGSNKYTTATIDDVELSSLEARAKFGANLIALSGLDLAHVILTLERECPEALEHLLPENKDAAPHLEINTDAIQDPSLFKELYHYVSEHTLSSGRSEQQQTKAQRSPEAALTTGASSALVQPKTATSGETENSSSNNRPKKRRKS